MSEEIDRLFERYFSPSMPPHPQGRLQAIAPGSTFEYTAFFPGGKGLWNAPTNDRFPRHGVMVLGNTFDSPQNFKKFHRRGYAGVAPNGAPCERTEQGLIPLLSQAGIPLQQCWFTNAFPGLICLSSGSNNGKAGISPRSELGQWCDEFFKYCVTLMQPRLILALGMEPIRFIGRLADIATWKGTSATFRAIDCSGTSASPAALAGIAVTAVALIHPSRRYGNRSKRDCLPAEWGEDREVELLRRAYCKAV
jgi:hypothetical protein